MGLAASTGDVTRQHVRKVRPRSVLQLAVAWSSDVSDWLRHTSVFLWDFFSFLITRASCEACVTCALPVFTIADNEREEEARRDRAASRPEERLRARRTPALADPVPLTDGDVLLGGCSQGEAAAAILFRIVQPAASAGFRARVPVEVIGWM